MTSMKIEMKNELIKTITSRFGDFHQYSFDELVSKPIEELNEIASQDSKELFR